MVDDFGVADVESDGDALGDAGGRFGIVGVGGGRQVGDAGKQLQGRFGHSTGGFHDDGSKVRTLLAARIGVFGDFGLYPGFGGTEGFARGGEAVGRGGGEGDRYVTVSEGAGKGAYERNVGAFPIFEDVLSVSDVASALGAASEYHCDVIVADVLGELAEFGTG